MKDLSNLSRALMSDPKVINVLNIDGNNYRGAITILKVKVRVVGVSSKVY